MKVAATDETLAQVLSRSFFKIPRFQRPYSWEESEVAEWLTDTLTGATNYFIGSMVTYSDGGMLQIVDGQQRLTTVTLFMAALRDHFLDLNDEKLANGAQSVIERQDWDFNNRFVLETTSSRPYLQLSLQAHPDNRDDRPPTATTHEEKLLKQAYDLCYERLESMMNEGISTRMETSRRRKRQTDVLKALRDRVLNLTLIYIELDNEEDAYTVFETLNFRGRDLTAADLVRSHVMKMIPPNNATVDNTRDRWNKIERQISDSKSGLDLGDFIYTSWVSRNGTTPKKALCRSLREQIVSIEAARDYLDEIEVDVRLYRGIHEPSSIVWATAARPIKRPLIAIQNLDVNQHLPLLMTALRASRARNQITHQKVNRLVDSIESFYMLTTAIAGKRPPGGFGSQMASFAKELYKADSRQKRSQIIDRVIEKLKEQLPDADVIRAACHELLYTRDLSLEKVVIRHILERLHLTADSGNATDYEKMSIEHIAPQSSIGVLVSRQHASQLGNLLLVPKRLNEHTLKNKSYADKREHLIKWTVPEDPIHKLATWNSDAIILRTAWMAEQVVSKFYKLRH